MQLIVLSIVEKLTNSDSKHMEFIIPDFTENSFIIHSAWNMNERNIEASFKINVVGTKKFFDSLDERMQKGLFLIQALLHLKELNQFMENISLKLKIIFCQKEENFKMWINNK